MTHTIAKIIGLLTCIGADLDLIKGAAARAVDQQWIILFSN
jgi:hypothetical protein